MFIFVVIVIAVDSKESNCTKLQTGGPDGDLGSNEIKISTDKTIGIFFSLLYIFFLSFVGVEHGKR